MTYLHGPYTWYTTVMNLPQQMFVIATMNHIINWQQLQQPHLSEKCPWTYTGTRGHCCLRSICTAKCQWQQIATTRGKSAHKKWCKYGVMRTRLQCTQFLRARACIKSRSGRKWQIWDSDHFLRKICGLWIWPSTIQNTWTQYLPHKFHPIHVWEQTVGTLITGTPVFQKIHTSRPYAWWTFINHDFNLLNWIELNWTGLEWGLWPWSLTVSYNNCKCLHHLFPSAVSVNTQTCGLYPSQQFKIWCCLDHNYQKYQHTDFSTETKKKITECLLFLNIFKSFIEFRSYRT